MTEPFWDFPIELPRHAFSPREVARAGDVWRAFQEAAISASSRAGWPPARYRETGTAFLIRSVTALHERETHYGDALRARTWVSQFRRDMFCTRQVELLASEGRVAAAVQEWVHITEDLKPVRAGAELLRCFPVHEVHGEGVAMPELLPATSPAHQFSFRCWHTWMDPLAHVNHPAYVDWADEATAVVLARAGIDPQALGPVAEKVLYRLGVVGGDEMIVESRVTGRTADGAVALTHRVLKAGGTPCADVVTVRRLTGRSSDALAAAFGA